MKNKIQNLGDLINLFEQAQLIDSNYPVRGCHIWMPDGFELKERVFSRIEKVIQKEGYKRYQFPILNSGKSIRIVTKEIENYENNLFWLRKKNSKNLDLFMSPVGESAIYSMFKRWIKQQSDLPLRMYLKGPTFRYHHDPSILLNGDESSTTLEAHGAFSNKENLLKEYINITKMFHQFLQNIGIPHLQLRRPRIGNKLCYDEMISFDTFLPSKKVSLNVAVVYNQGQIYSESFGINYFDIKSRTKNYSQQITFGIRERAILAMLDLHRDTYGLRMLPEFAPTQILVLPIHSKESSSDLDEYAHRIVNILSEKYRVEIDNSSKRYGKKIVKARQKGIPLRIGVNQDNLEQKTVRYSIRTDEDQPIYNIPFDNLLDNITPIFDKIQTKIVYDAKNIFQSTIIDANSFNELEDIVMENLIARLYLCGNDNHQIKIENDLKGELIGTEIKDKSGLCIMCGKKSNYPSYYSRRASSP